MEVKLLEDAPDSLLPQWAALFAADPRATPFISSIWAEAWFRNCLGSARPWILVVREGTELVGLAPLVARRRGPLQTLEVLDREHGDYWDVLALPAARDRVLEAVGSEIARRRDEWDVFLLDGLPHDTTTPKALSDAGLRLRGRRPVRCPGIELPATFEEYLATLPSKRRNLLRRRLRKLDGGELELREIREQDELGEAVSRWHELHVRRWDETGKSLYPRHRSASFRDFTLDVVRAFIPAGHALMWEFLHDGEVVGSYINFLDEHTFYVFLGGFDPRAASLSVGNVATAEAIRWSIASNRRYFDFTRGSEPHKYWYGAVDRYSPSFLVGNGRARSRLALPAIGTRDRLRGKSAEHPYS